MCGNGTFDVLVIGAGHAGCEAALAAARMGARTALLTLDIQAVARMSCNPSIGGMAKSHMVFELDALGGEMAVNTDCTGIQFRVLNTRKGPAVQANRVQCDKPAYSLRMQQVLLHQANLTLIEDDIQGVQIQKDTISGVFGRKNGLIPAKTVILTAGTFLRGRIYVGKEVTPGGRMGEEAEEALSGQLTDIGFETARMKTGTPPRLHKDSIDYGRMERQDGFEPPPFFSWACRSAGGLFGRNVPRGTSEAAGQPGVPRGTFPSPPFAPWIPGEKQIPCWITHTTEETMGIIQAHLQDSALYGGLIDVGSPRYCPSIEDKVVKFASRKHHHIFIEPEGRAVPEIYPNGTSNSLPLAIQERMIHSIPGLENAVLLQPGYAIQYDYFPPTQLLHSLESKRVAGLFFAGQVNGTTGYEEAAVQGFMAGVNAVFKLRREEPLVFRRHEAYTGVLIDDLVTKGTDEPYRMFTSRAEHRLLLRQDNAVFRMADAAERVGIVPKGQLEEIRGLERDIQQELERLQAIRVEGITLYDRLRRPGESYATVCGLAHGGMASGEGEIVEGEAGDGFVFLPQRAQRTQSASREVLQGGTEAPEALHGGGLEEKNHEWTQMGTNLERGERVDCERGGGKRGTGLGFFTTEAQRRRRRCTESASREVLQRGGEAQEALCGVKGEGVPRWVQAQVEFAVKYSGYIAREERKIAQSAQFQQVRIPADIQYMEILPLRYEAREKLSAIRPVNLEQAGRISGVTPADISVLSVWIKRMTAGRG